MHRVIALTLTLLLLTTALPIVDAERTERSHYLPGLVFAGVTCSGEQHDWVPTSPPGDGDHPIGWALSGDPECAPNDLRNIAQGTNDAGGFGAGVFPLEPVETIAIVTTVDEVFGAGDSYLRAVGPESESTGERDAAEGCGPQVVRLPLDITHPAPNSPPRLLWAFVEAAGATDDLSSVCFATTGWVEATIT